ncbi:MAG TPA: SMP-30/gluconolactonase/LRE family protein [Myxococcota bacterium]|nr:SMP-30/gluconolactonase/LRE family protein [Myxococcota bacterium]
MSAPGAARRHSLTLRAVLVAGLLAPLGARAQFAQESPELEVVRLDPRLDALIAPGTRAEKIVAGHVWLEGPSWDARSSALLFSDVVKNRLWRWTPGGGTDVALDPSGTTAPGRHAAIEPGSNGTAFDAEGRLLICQHGARRVVRLEANGELAVVADGYQGRRLNSPNDLWVARSGEVYFTDPPFGLPKHFDDPAKELAWQGVYRLRGRELELLIRDVRAPNGVALSPDERTLYVSNADRDEPVWLAYSLGAGGRIGAGRVFADARREIATYAGVPDGMETDANGNLWAAGPGGLTIFAPDGARLGFLRTGIATSNVTFGGERGTTAFITASSAIWRIETRVRGAAATRH